MGSKKNDRRAAGREREGGDWISGRAAMRMLGWTNPDSVRNAAKQDGRFAWRKLPNGRIAYLRSDVERYATFLHGDVPAEAP